MHHFYPILCDLLQWPDFRSTPTQTNTQWGFSNLCQQFEIIIMQARGGTMILRYGLQYLYSVVYLCRVDGWTC